MVAISFNRTHLKLCYKDFENNFYFQVNLKYIELIRINFVLNIALQVDISQYFTVK